MVNEFTLGPWELERKFLRVVTPSKNGLRKVVALVGRQRNYEEQEANARLIVAAPEMYEKLNDFVSEIEDFLSVYDSSVFNDEFFDLVNTTKDLLARIDEEATNE